jgi:transposase
MTISLTGSIHIRKNSLKGFSGYLHADGYDGYHKLPENITVVGCWAHLRRKLFDALKALPKDKQPDSNAAKGSRILR